MVIAGFNIWSPPEREVIKEFLTFARTPEFAATK